MVPSRQNRHSLATWILLFLLPSVCPLTSSSVGRRIRISGIIPLLARRFDNDDDDDLSYYNDDPYDNEDYYRPVRPVGGSDAEQELQSMPMAADDTYNDGDDDLVSLDRPRRQRRRAEEWDDYPEDDYEDEIDESLEEGSSGNFWSNPTNDLDDPRLTKKVARRTERRPPPTRRSKKRRTTFRSGIPEPPPPVSDFYNRLFWYGFDPDEAADSPADKTMFGGTKGKFNGLAYLYDGGLTLPPSQRRRKSRALPYRDDDDDDEDLEAYKGEYIERTAPRGDTPPYDSPRPRRSDREVSVSSRPSTRRSRRRQQLRNGYMDNGVQDNEDRNRQTDIASWFDVDDDEEEGNSFNPFDIFLGRNRQSLSRQAEEYNRSMGLDGENSLEPRNGRRRRNPQRSRRPGFAYPYNAQEDDDDDRVVEIETILEEGNAAEKSSDAEVPPPVRRQEMTWEERSLAMERVPPANIPAWGPSGALGVDARTHAITEAVQDIIEAQRRVEAKEARVEKTREELSILKVDAELERKRLQQKRGDPRRIQELMRELDLDVEDAARAFRYAQLQLQTAREELNDTETRHWGLISFYDPTQAKNGIEEAFRELEESEPAVRRVKEKMLEEERRLEVEGQAANGGGEQADKEEAEK